MLSFFAIIPAVLLIQQAVVEASPRAAFRWGWWYGLVSNALVLYWMVVALWHFTPLSALGYLATIGVLGLLTGTMFWFVVRMRLALPRVPLWVVLPVDRKSTRLNPSHGYISYAVFCLKKKKKNQLIVA